MAWVDLDHNRIFGFPIPDFFRFPNLSNRNTYDLSFIFSPATGQQLLPSYHHHRFIVSYVLFSNLVRPFPFP